MNQPGANQHAMQTEVHQVAGLIQSRMCSEFQMHEECIPAAKAAARCSIFVTQDWHENPRLCVFMQHGAGVTPGLWAIPPPPSSHQGSPASIQAFSHSLASMSLIPYIKAARKSGYAVLVMNPSTNRMSVQGHSVKILHSSSPEEHVLHVWTTYIQPSAASLIHFISHDTSGLLVNHLLSHLDPRLHPLLARRGVHFEPSAEPMFHLVTTGASARYCSTLSVGRLSSENSSCLLQSVQSSTFVFLKVTTNYGLQPALQAIRTTVPNKLVVTVNRARLTGQPYNNPYAVVTCVGQSKATVGNNKKTMDPEWNQTFSFPVRDETASVLVKVKDKAFLPMSSMVGGVAVALADVGWNRVWRHWFTLRHDTSNQHQYHQVHGNGEIELTLEWVHDTFVARTDSFLAPSPPLSPPLASVAQDNGCYLCSCTFVLHRRRYCRLCLRAVCVSCSDRLFLPGFSEAKRSEFWLYIEDMHAMMVLLPKISTKDVLLNYQELTLLCLFTSWYEALRVHSIRSIAIPLPEEFVASLLQDQILVQEDLYPSSFVAAVKDAIHRLGGRVFAKLDWSSAKDAKWILANSLCCRSFADILMLLKASDFITHDLTQAYDGCSDVGTKRRPDTFHLVLKKWCHLFDSMHFRCFVRAKKLLGISQRNCTERYDFLASEATQDTLCDAIAAFFESHLTTSQALPDPNYVFDVYVDKDHKVHLIDINVFGAVTDPLLFSWDELKQPATAEDERIHFRVVTTARSAMYSDPYGQYRVP
ncbi:hypothetical protein B5M09_008173, partial [Aphanomyces astaci]